MQIYSFAYDISVGLYEARSVLTAPDNYVFWCTVVNCRLSQSSSVMALNWCFSDTITIFNTFRESATPTKCNIHEIFNFSILILHTNTSHPRQQDDALNASTAYIAVSHRSSGEIRPISDLAASAAAASNRHTESHALWQDLVRIGGK
jgi:hypothetical protein